MILRNALTFFCVKAFLLFKGILQSLLGILKYACVEVRQTVQGVAVYSSFCDSFG